MRHDWLVCLAVCFTVFVMPAAAADAFRVIDGDTFEWRDAMVRIANIDAPEVRSAKCDAEQRLGVVAGHRLTQLLGSGAISIIPGDPATGRQRDRHNRLLAIVTVDGRDIGEMLVTERLARPWTGHRSPWCTQ